MPIIPRGSLVQMKLRTIINIPIDVRKSRRINGAQFTEEGVYLAWSRPIIRRLFGVGKGGERNACIPTCSISRFASRHAS